MNVKLEKIAERKFALYLNGNYCGTFPKTIVNIKLRAWGLQEI